MSNFIQNCLNGNALLDEIDDYIDRWHSGDSDMPLHTYLGMSREEYASWIESPDNLIYIVAAHRCGTNRKDAIA